MRRVFPAMEWKFFIGASMLAFALLGPWAPMSDVVGGIALAAVINWKLFRPGATSTGSAREQRTKS